MAIQFMDSCQEYTVASQLYDFYDNPFGTAGLPQLSGGRSGTNCLHLASSGGVILAVAKRLNSNFASGGLGQAVQITNYPTGSTAAIIMGLIDAEFSGGSWVYTAQVTAQINSSANWKLVCGSTTLGTTSTPPFTDGNYHFIELVCTISTTTSGSASLWIDGVQVLNVTGAVTAATANSYWNSYGYWSNGGVITGPNICDIYAFDTSGGSPWNARLGDVKVLYQAINGNGSTNDFTPQAASWAASTVYAKNAIIVDTNGNIQLATTNGTSKTGSAPTWNVTTGGTTTDNSVTWTNKGTATAANWKYVCNLPPNDAQAYLSDNTLNDFDLYTAGAFAGTTQPIAVAVTVRGYKDQSYLCSLRALCKSGSTTVDNGTDFPLNLGSANAFDYLGIFELDPNTSAQWASVSAVNSAQFGVKVTAV